jgi:tetratricopeptide (TPR) repeat protein
MRDDRSTDRRAIEKKFAGLQKIMRVRRFSTLEQAQEYVNGFKGGPVPELDGPKTPAETAQELVYEAYEKPERKDRILLAYKALYIHSDCAGAYNLLAEEDAGSDKEALDFYMKAEAAGRRGLGDRMINDNFGNLWAIIEARPYMRAMEGVALGLWRTGKRSEAIKKCREMLDLNNNDNQGIRYHLVTFLTEEHKFSEVDAFMKSGLFKDDYDIEWFYTRPLVSFAVSGDTVVARKGVEEALRRNPHVLKFMTGSAKLPESLPEKFTPKSEEEAAIYVANNLGMWFMIPEAVEWFSDTANTLMEKHGFINEGKG